jgi:2-polyprenyl-6-methoxyphenol hydroxylase-like FAD-dependent oxidoreductase
VARADLYDVAVVGGGPAGLGVAIECARRGLSVVVAEQHPQLPDKACGEGIMPSGVRVLESLGVRARLSPNDSAPLAGVSYVDSKGRFARGRLPSLGLAVRRTALVEAMCAVARAEGAEIRLGCRVLSYRRAPNEVCLATSQGWLAARVLVAADGLTSHLRHAEGLDVPCRGERRFGLRRHFACPPWSSSIEIHLADDAEAYVTPVSDRCVGVAFLWSEPWHADRFEATTGRARWTRLATKFPALAERLGEALAVSEIRGAGPLRQRSRARVADRFALVGDAAGYVDAITGEGIALALSSASALARALPDALVRGATRASLAGYEREASHLFRRYALFTRSVLGMVERPALRRSALSVFRRAPGLFDMALSAFAE